MSVSARTVRLVAKKELLEAVRDRRTLFVALILPVLLYPLMMVAVGPLVGRQRQRLQQTVQKVVVTGLGQSAVLEHVLIDPEPPAPLPGVPEDEQPEPKTLGLEVVDVDDPAAALAAGEISLWIDVAAEAEADLASDATAGLIVHRDSSDDASRAAYSKLTRAIDRAETRIVRERLARRELPPTLVRPLHVAEVTDVASPEQRAGYLFGKVIALLLVLMTLSSSFYPAVDVVAGEKERGTMETLLVAPCGRAELVLGKYLAVLTVTLSAAVLNLFSLWLTMGPLVGSLGLPGGEGLDVNVGVMLGILALLVPMGGLFSALSIGLSTMARSVKEAQHYLTPLFLLVMPLAMIVVIPSVELTPTLAAVPISNVVLFFRDLMIGKAAFGTGVIVFGTTAAVAGLALWATVQLFLREETLFRGPEGTGSLLQRPIPRRYPSSGAAVLLFTVALALIWYLQPLLPADDLLANVISTQLAVILAPCLLLAWWLRVDGRATFRIRRPVLLVLLLAVPLGLAAPVVNGWIQHLVWGAALPTEGPMHRLEEAFALVLESQPWWMLVLLFGALPALCEELVFRGFVMSGFGPGRSGIGRSGHGRPGAKAVLGAAVLFALFHIYPEKWLSTFLVGALLGLLAVAARSIWPAVVAHALNNASLVLVPKTDEGSLLRLMHDRDVEGHGLVVALAAVVVVGCVAAVVVVARRSDDADPPPPGELDAPPGVR